MARFDKFQVMAKIAAAPMVPVFYNKDAEVCKNVIKACYAGGVRAFEFTNRGDFAQNGHFRSSTAVVLLKMTIFGRQPR